MLYSPNRILKHQAITNASLTVAGEHALHMILYFCSRIDRYYADTVCIIDCHRSIYLDVYALDQV